MDITCNYCHITYKKEEFRFLEEFNKLFCPICGSSDNDFNLQNEREELAQRETLAQEEEKKRPPQRVIYRKLHEMENL